MFEFDKKGKGQKKKKRHLMSVPNTSVETRESGRMVKWEFSSAGVNRFKHLCQSVLSSPLRLEGCCFKTQPDLRVRAFCREEPKVLPQRVKRKYFATREQTQNLTKWTPSPEHMLFSSFFTLLHSVFSLWLFVGDLHIRDSV